MPDNVERLNQEDLGLVFLFDCGGIANELWDVEVLLEVFVGAPVVMLVAVEEEAEVRERDFLVLVVILRLDELLFEEAVSVHDLELVQDKAEGDVLAWARKEAVLNPEVHIVNFQSDILQNDVV